MAPTPIRLLTTYGPRRVPGAIGIDSEGAAIIWRRSIATGAEASGVYPGASAPASDARSWRGGSSLAPSPSNRSFVGDWPGIVGVSGTEGLVERAETLAGDHGLRGHDAVQLASALAWQECVGAEIVLATFDQQLWEAAPEAGSRAWPDKLSR